MGLENRGDYSRHSNVAGGFVIAAAVLFVIGLVLGRWSRRLTTSHPVPWSRERRQMFIADETRELR
jgi:hypothetical protein